MTRRLTTCRSECISPYADAIGYVTNMPGDYDRTRAHMSQVICGRPECRRRAERQVRAFTGEEPSFCEFSVTA